jgi:hypothetical protein
MERVLRIYMGRHNFVELVMKNALVADSSFGTFPAPFCEFPSDPGIRHRSRQAARGEWSPRVRIAVGLSVMAVLMCFVGVTSLLQFGAFDRKADAPADTRIVQEFMVKEAPVHSTEGDSK